MSVHDSSSSLTRVFRMCKTGLHPLYVNVEPITPDHHVVSQHEELSQWCILGENIYTLKFSSGIILYATTVVSKIRCININITCNQNIWHDMAIIILCFWYPSPKQHHDLHRHRRDTLISIIASGSLTVSWTTRYSPCRLPISWIGPSTPMAIYSWDSSDNPCRIQERLHKTFRPRQGLS